MPTLLQILPTYNTARATEEGLAFSRPLHPAATVVRILLGWTAQRCSRASPAKGHKDKAPEPIICVSSRSSMRQTAIVLLFCDVGAFHRSHKSLWIIEILLIISPLLLILRHCRECEISVRLTCSTKIAVVQLLFLKPVDYRAAMTYLMWDEMYQFDLFNVALMYMLSLSPDNTQTMKPGTTCWEAVDSVCVHVNVAEIMIMQTLLLTEIH